MNGTYALETVTCYRGVTSAQTACSPCARTLTSIFGRIVRFVVVVLLFVLIICTTAMVRDRRRL